MKNSDQIKRAPDPAGKTRTRQIFQNFTDATITLLEWPDTPEALREALDDAITEAGNQIGRLPSVEFTRETLSWILGLDGDRRQEAVSSTEDGDEEADRAAIALASAFATIEEYRDYLPASLYNEMANAVQRFYDQADWQSNPAVLRKVLPHILREAIANETEKEGA